MKLIYPLTFLSIALGASPASARNDNAWENAQFHALRAFELSEDVAEARDEALAAMGRDAVAGAIDTLVVFRECTPACYYRIQIRQLLAKDNPNSSLRSLSATYSVIRSTSTGHDGTYHWMDAQLQDIAFR